MTYQQISTEYVRVLRDRQCIHDIIAEDAEIQMETAKHHYGDNHFYCDDCEIDWQYNEIVKYPLRGNMNVCCPVCHEELANLNW